MWWVFVAAVSAAVGQPPDECWQPARAALESVGAVWTGTQPDDTRVGCREVVDGMWGSWEYTEEKLARSAERDGCRGARVLHRSYAAGPAGCSVICVRLKCYAEDVDLAPEMETGIDEVTLLALLRKSEPEEQLPEEDDYASLEAASEEAVHPDEEELVPPDPPSSEDPARLAGDMTGLAVLLERQSGSSETEMRFPRRNAKLAQPVYEPEPIADSVVAEANPQPIAILEQAPSVPESPLPAASPELRAFQVEIGGMIDEFRRSRESLREKRREMRERSRAIRDDWRRKRDALRFQTRQLGAARP